VNSLDDCFWVRGEVCVFSFVGSLDFLASFVFSLELLPAFGVKHRELLTIDLLEENSKLAFFMVAPVEVFSTK
jgi:hypothetical protein